MTPRTPTDFVDLMNFFIEFINLIIGAIFALAFLVLIWKLIDAWILHVDDAGKREEGKTIAITAVIVMVIMLSIWGILSLLRNSI